MCSRVAGKDEKRRSKTRQTTEILNMCFACDSTVRNIQRLLRAFMCLLKVWRKSFSHLPEYFRVLYSFVMSRSYRKYFIFRVDESSKCKLNTKTNSHKNFGARQVWAGVFQNSSWKRSKKKLRNEKNSSTFIFRQTFILAINKAIKRGWIGSKREKIYTQAFSGWIRCVQHLYPTQFSFVVFVCLRFMNTLWSLINEDWMNFYPPWDFHILSTCWTRRILIDDLNCCVVLRRFSENHQLNLFF